MKKLTLAVIVGLALWAILFLTIPTQAQRVRVDGVGAGIVPTTDTFVTQTPSSTLTAEQALSLLSTGFMFVTTTTGAVTSIANPIPGVNGGTGVANTSKTITLGGNLVTSGAFATTFTVTGTTGVTLPTSGTLLANGGASATFTQFIGGGSVPAVANTSANSCGTDAALIAGTDGTGFITVGATSGTSCTVTWTTAAPTRRQCWANNGTAGGALVRHIYTDTTHSNFVGIFAAADKIEFGCMVY